MSGPKPTALRRVALLAAMMSALLVVPASGGASLNSLGSAAAVAAPSSPGPASSSSYHPAVGFTALEYPVRFFGRIFGANEWTDGQDAPPTYGRMWFGEVTADRRSQDKDLSFAVEGQHDPSGYQFCETPDTCEDVNIRISPEGLLYLHKQQLTPPDHQFGYFADFPTRTVELSATDADTPLKVYREVLVGPPASVTGCEDYGENNPDAFACLFLREVIPNGVDASNEEALRASLPGLVQPAANYSLVLAEEFDGTPPAANAAGCRDGLSTLDSDVWNYYNACDNTDSRGEPCGNVVSDQLVFGLAGTCSFWLLSAGKLHAKYGYLEIEFTVNMDHWRAYQNYNAILFSRGEKLRFLLDRYGVNIEDNEDYFTHLDTEIDFLEYDVGGRSFIAHQFGNIVNRFADSGVPPTATSRWYTFCHKSQSLSIIRNPNRRCNSSDTFTVTLGLEWTPRGYRNFVRVHEFQDEMIVVPKDKISVSIQPIGADSHVQMTGSAKDAYFEYLDPKDTDTLLEQAVVTHVPLPFGVEAWGYLHHINHSYLRTRMKIDYVRWWQPENHYSDMEPVYQ